MFCASEIIRWVPCSSARRSIHQGREVIIRPKRTSTTSVDKPAFTNYLRTAARSW
jgi:hypothetical protein